jgi:branched-chain amino acid transport system permease protein
VPGALIAGLIVGLIQAVSAFSLGAIYKDIVVYGLFVVLLWLRPQGLMGKA